MKIFSKEFQRVRVAILLSVLVLTAATIELRLRRIRSWDRVLVVGIYPVAATPATAAHVGALTEADFAPLVSFLQREGARYGVRFSPLVQVRLGRPVDEPPPELADGASPLDIIQWSLALRLYSFRMRQAHALPPADIEFFVLYHPEGSPRTLDRSLAVGRLRVAIVHAEASRGSKGWTNVALAHELLHVAGAADRYDQRGAPVFPDGYGDPGLTPLHPQPFAEIMSGQVAVDTGQFREPTGLDECIVGPATAAEIGWRRPR